MKADTLGVSLKLPNQFPLDGLRLNFVGSVYKCSKSSHAGTANAAGIPQAFILLIHPNLGPVDSTAITTELKWQTPCSSNCV